MALCLAKSLLISKGFDANDLMSRFCRWWNEGYLSSTGECFDIGVTVSESLLTYKLSGNPFSGSTDPMSAGNGSIMRLAPIPMFFYDDLEQTISNAILSSKTTHGAEECLEACVLFSVILRNALKGEDKYELLKMRNSYIFVQNKIKEISRGLYFDKDLADINGSGYVVESLEAALWCFEKSNNFESAILSAVNLGNDADTTAAVCGQLAGAYYGFNKIPKKWRDKLYMHDMILNICDELFSNSIKLN